MRADGESVEGSSEVREEWILGGTTVCTLSMLRRPSSPQDMVKCVGLVSRAQQGVVGSLMASRNVYRAAACHQAQAQAQDTILGGGAARLDVSGRSSGGARGGRVRLAEASDEPKSKEL